MEDIAPTTIIAVVAVASLLLGAALNRWWALGAPCLVYVGLGMSQYGDALEGDLGWDFAAIFSGVSATGVVVGIAARRALSWATRERAQAHSGSGATDRVER